MAKAVLDDMTLGDLQAEIRRRERRQRSLAKKRERLVEQIAEIDAELSELGAPEVGGVRRRARNEQNLAEALVDLLTGQQLNVTKIAQEVQRAGYRTTSPNFRTIVNQTLIKDSRFERVGRGTYTTKTGASSPARRPKKKSNRKKRGTRG